MAAAQRKRTSTRRFGGRHGASVMEFALVAIAYPIEFDAPLRTENVLANLGQESIGSRLSRGLEEPYE